MNFDEVLIITSNLNLNFNFKSDLHVIFLDPLYFCGINKRVLSIRVSYSDVNCHRFRPDVIYLALLS